MSANENISYLICSKCHKKLLNRIDKLQEDRR
jgi:hypothetical protein